MALDFGSFVGGFAERTLERADEARRRRRETLLLGVDTYKQQLQTYKKKRAERQEKVQIAQTVIDTTAENFTPQQILQAGNAVGWKDAAEVQKFLRESGNFKPTATTRPTLDEQTQRLFGPEPEAPIPAIPTQQERGILDVFSPRTLPSVSEIQAATGVAPLGAAPVPPPPALPSQPPAPTPTAVAPAGVQVPFSIEQRNVLEDMFRTDSRLANRRGPEGSEALFFPVNQALADLRRLGSAVVERQTKQGQGDLTALFNNFVNEVAPILSAPVFTEVGATEPIREITPENSAAIDSVARLMTQFNTDPTLFETLRTSTSKIIDPELFQQLEDNLNQAYIDTAILPIEQAGLTRDQAKLQFSQAIKAIGSRRGARVRELLRQRLQPSQVAGEQPLVAPEREVAPAVQELALTSEPERAVPATSSPPPERFVEGALTPFGERLRPSAARALSRELAERRRGEETVQTQTAAPETLQERAARSLRRALTTEASASEVIGNVFSESPEEVQTLLDGLDGPSQLAASILIEQAQRRGENFSDRAKREISIALQSPVEIDNAVQYIQDNEGEFSGSVFKDSLGNDTIGFGFNLERADARKILNDVIGTTRARNLLRNKDEKLSEKEGTELFTKTLAEAEVTANKVVDNFEELPKEIQIVLIDMAYNLGEPGLKQFEDTLSAIANRDFVSAAENLLNSDYAFQVGRRAVKNAKVLAGF